MKEYIKAVKAKRKNTLNQAELEVGDKLEVNIKDKQLSLGKPNTFKDKWREFVDNGGIYERGEYNWDTLIEHRLW